MTSKTIAAKEKVSWEKAQELGKGMREAGRHVWLAGLGAVQTLDQGGRGLFSDLVARGRRVASEERPALEERFRKAGDRMTGLRERLEVGVEERLAHALKRFGVPDRDQVQQLIERVEQLTRKVEKLAAAKTRAA